MVWVEVATKEKKIKLKIDKQSKNSYKDREDKYNKKQRWKIVEDEIGNS